MAGKEEIHDPDYPEAPVCVKDEPQSLTDEEKVEKIKEVIRREFLNELEIRENEIMLIDQRMTTSRRLLHRLRYTLVSGYYKDQKLQMTNGQIQDEIAAQHEPRARAEAVNLLRDGQRRLHPSVRKLVGKQTVDIEDIFKTRAPRNKLRKDYNAMLQKRNYTISADTTKSLRPDTKLDMVVYQQPSTSKPTKKPRRLDPKITNVVTLDEVTRNKLKYRYRIVIGNTSKYAPGASRADRSTHKWLLYVRGPAHAPDVSAIVTAVSVTLHHSYAPHHTVYINKPPYHVSRRGWGEFPAKIELHFALADRNRPATLEHTIKLDRNYTGMQMLGAETVVDVWLYSTPEMLQYEYKENIETPIKIEQPEPIPDTINENTDKVTDKTSTQTDDWMDFFAKGPAEVDVDEMIIKPIKKEIINEQNDACNSNEDTLNENIQEISQNDVCNEVSIKTEKEFTESEKIEDNVPSEILNQPKSPKKRIIKYIDPSTGKIFYLEMDRNLDLSTVQEIVINNTKTAKISPLKGNGLRNFRKKKGGVSLLKPEVKNMLKNEGTSIVTKNKMNNFSHIENDHCYLATPKRTDSVAIEIKKEQTLYKCLCNSVARLNNVRAAVNYLLKKIPLISDLVRDPDFLKHFPFVVENEEKYWKFDFAKRRNIEWSRAKLINKLLQEHLTTTDTIWRTKQILLYSRLHGFYPVRNEATTSQSVDQWSSWNHIETMESSIKEIYPTPNDINTLSVVNFDALNASVTDVIDLSDDEDVDVICKEDRVCVKKEVTSEGSLVVLPVESEEDRQRYMFVERKCADIGIELRNEDVGSGYSYSAVHAVILSAMKSFAEELLRGALAVKLQGTEPGTSRVWVGESRVPSQVSAGHVHGACVRSPRTTLLSGHAIARPRTHAYTI